MINEQLVRLVLTNLKNNESFLKEEGDLQLSSAITNINLAIDSLNNILTQVPKTVLVCRDPVNNPNVFFKATTLVKSEFDEWSNGNKIPAIKKYRMRTGHSLAESVAVFSTITGIGLHHLPNFD